MKKVFTLALCVSVIVLLSVVGVLAGPPVNLVRGEYSFIGSRTCVNNNLFQEFGANFALGANGGYFRTAHASGTLTLNGDGTGTMDFELIQYYFESTSPYNLPVGVFQGSCDMEYVVNANGSISLTETYCESLGTGGVGSGNTYANDNVVLTLAASRDGEMLLMTNTTPVVEDTWNVSNTAAVTKRICSRTMTAIRQSIR